MKKKDIENISLTSREKEYVLKNKDKSSIEETLKRYNTISTLVKGDDIGENLLSNLIEKASEYVKVICKNDVIIRTQAMRLEGEEFRELMTELDRRRKSAHDALISALYALNRYCLREYVDCPKGGIYSLDPLTIHNRVAVADWAGQLIYGIFISRKK
jgi:hypothetical protein